MNNIPYTPIPHPPIKPIFKNLFDFSHDEPVQGTMHLVKKYGEIVQLFFPPKLSVVVLSSFRLVKEVCDETRFDKNLSKPLIEVRDFAGDGLFTAWTKEANWQKAHNILLPGLGQRAIKGYFPMMLDIAQRLLAKWHNIPSEQYFNLTDDMTRLTFDTIGLCGFDYRFHSFASEKPHPFISAMNVALEDSMRRMALLPVQRFWRFHKNRQYRQSVAFMNQVVDEIIKERKLNPHKYISKADFMSLMMNATDLETGEKLDDLNIRYQILTFLIAGHETTSGLLSFAFYFLMTHPKILQKAYQEVDAVLGNDLSHLPLYAQVLELKYIQQILLETLRLWPTAPGFALYPYQNTVLANQYYLPQKQPILVLTPMLHRDKAIWGENAESFDPDNFSSEAVAIRDADAFKPFGNGQRACIGRQFAMLEATLVMGMILQRYKLQLKPDYQLKIKETLSIKPDNLMVRIEHRKESERILVQKESKKTDKIEVSTSHQHQTPLLILFGSNMGASEDFALRIAKDGAKLGFQPKVLSLDEAVDRLADEKLVVMITSTYNGTPPNNSTKFQQRIANENKPDAFSKLHYTVFGCGNTQWKTFQAFPRWIDEQLEKKGAHRFYKRGEADASRDFDEAFETWYEGFWETLQNLLQISPAPVQSLIPTLAIKVLEDDASYLTFKPILKTSEVFLTVQENKELQSSDSGRSTKHIVLELPEKLSYQNGDYLVITPENPTHLIERICKHFKLSPQQWIQLEAEQGLFPHFPTYIPIKAFHILQYCVELHDIINRNQLKLLAEFTICPPEKAKLKELAEDDTKFNQEVLHKQLTLWDLLVLYPACDISFEQFLTLLKPLKSRYFSISSSPLVKSQQCSLTVGVIKEPSKAGVGDFEGICTNYLASLSVGDQVRGMIVTNNSAFHLPPISELIRPILMVATGTGIAPFISFLEELAIRKAQGNPIAQHLLFFGCRHPEHDFLYAKELQEWEQQGILKIHPAFSRLYTEKIYVQHLLLEQQDLIWELIHSKSQVYVCGSTAMAQEVRKSLIQILRIKGNVSQETAENEFIHLQNTNQYIEDVWGD